MGTHDALIDYVPVLVQILLAGGLAAVILVASQIFGQRGRANRSSDTAYECGIPSEGRTATRFAVKFYIVAMLFILFDIEIVFLIPWVLVFREFIAAGIPILAPVMFFLAVLVIGLLYEYKKGALEWED